MPRTRLHRLSDMLAIAICAVVCGAEGWTDIAQFGRAKERWLRTFLALPNGIPSHDTFGRVFAALDPDAFERCFLNWTAALAEAGGVGAIHIDGKALRRSFDKASSRAAIHLVSAWASECELVLGQRAVDEKSNEITAIPKLLDLLTLHGAVVTIDAMGCQREIAGKIVEGGGDYVLALKGNQGTMHEEVEFLFDEAIAHGWEGMQYDYREEVEGDHGRIETRRCWCTGEVGWFRDRAAWAGLRSFACVEATREVDGETSTERRYYISSLDGRNAEALARLVRRHWSVENQLHWSLDVSFSEDDCRIRQGHGAENHSRLRRIALNLLQREKTAKVGIKAKRLKAGWDEKYLLKVLRI